VCVPACTTYRLVTSLLFAERYRENVALVGATGVSHQSCFCSSMACVSTVCERVCERNTSEIVRLRGRRRRGSCKVQLLQWGGLVFLGSNWNSERGRDIHAAIASSDRCVKSTPSPSLSVLIHHINLRRRQLYLTVYTASTVPVSSSDNEPLY
jgi:hypothetical protein